MLCPSCNGKYDSEDRAAHKLAECGHAICEQCWKAFPVQAVVVCPTCGRRQVKAAVASRRSAKEPARVEQRPSEEEESSEEEEEDPFEQQSASGATGSDLLCAAHCKGFEGFCLTCKSLLCLDCIFEKHKSHDFMPLDKAKDRVANEMAKRQLELEGAREDFLQRLNAARAWKAELAAAFEKKLLEVRTLMNDLRRYIMLREQRLEEKVKEEFDRCKEDCHGLVLAAEKDLHKIDSVIASLKHHSTQRDIRYLGTPA